MAILANINYKGFNLENCYINISSFQVRRLPERVFDETTGQTIDIKAFQVISTFNVYANNPEIDTLRDAPLDTYTIEFKTDNPDSITWDTIWTKVRDYFGGADVIEPKVTVEAVPEGE